MRCSFASSSFNSSAVRPICGAGEFVAMWLFTSQWIQEFVVTFPDPSNRKIPTCDALIRMRLFVTFRPVRPVLIESEEVYLVATDKRCAMTPRQRWRTIPDNNRTGLRNICRRVRDPYPKENPASRQFICAYN